MAIDSLQMVTAVVSSVALPVLALNGLHLRGGWAWLSANLGANALSHAVPYLAHPDAHYGPAYSIAIIMYAVIIFMVSSMATFAAMAKSH